MTASIHTWLALTTLAAGVSVATAADPAPLTLVADGTSAYTIYVSPKASEAERWAAEELASHIKQMSGADLPIRTAQPDDVLEKAILIVGAGAGPRLGTPVDDVDLGADGFSLTTIGSNVLVLGGRPRGAMYGVFTLLEKLGCRWWTPTEATIPVRRTIVLEPLDELQVPVMEYRDLLYGDLWGDEGLVWFARNKVSGGIYRTIPEKMGGQFIPDIRMSHNVRFLMIGDVNPAAHMADHPEMWALRKGKRTTRQICMSDPKAVNAVIEGALNQLRTVYPKLVFVGQEDNNDYCQCDGCKALTVAAGDRPSGMTIHLANAVAEAVAEEFPDAYVMTPAYHWSQPAPKGIQPRDNVIVRIAAIEADCAHPIAAGTIDVNRVLKRDFTEWGKITRQLYCVNYTCNFDNYIMPFPNLRTLTPNVKFFTDNRTTGMFVLGPHTSPATQFSVLTEWVLAKAMWNPKADNDALVEEFCLGYYGPDAGPLILAYINLLHDEVQRRQFALLPTHATHICEPYLTGELIARSEQLFQQAETAAGDDPDLLRRVQIAHLPVQYMLLMRPRYFWPAAAKLSPALDWRTTAEQFARVGKASGLKRVTERGNTDGLYGWAMSYGAIDVPSGADLPAELHDADPATFGLVQGAQFDRSDKHVIAAPGAVDGWGQHIVTVGSGYYHRVELNGERDLIPGRTYRLFVRLKGKVAEGYTGPAVDVRLYTNGRKHRYGGTIPGDRLDGTWHTYDMGQFTIEADKGGYFAIMQHSSTRKTDNIVDVVLDCFWLAQQAE